MGSKSIVYCGVLVDVIVVVVKWFGICCGEIDVVVEKVFVEVFEILGIVCYWMVVKVFGYCCSFEIKVFVMEYFFNGMFCNFLYFILDVEVVCEFNWNYWFNVVIVVV